jgi:hypothetical protein
MKRGHLLTVLAILIISLLLWLIYITNVPMQEEFFSSEEDSYNSLKSKIESTMSPYCELARFIEGRMKKIYMTPKPLDNPIALIQERQKQAAELRKKGIEPPVYDNDSYNSPGDSEAEANARIQETYKDVYSCRDDLAGSRPSCNKFKWLYSCMNEVDDSKLICKAIKGLNFENIKNRFLKKSKDNHTPCSLYYNLPEYSEDTIDTIADELSKIPNNLASIISKEVEWYVSVMDELQKGLDVGAKPPEQVSDPKNAPDAPKGKTWDSDDGMDLKKKKEGFADKCSPEVARLKREKRKSSGYCIVPDLPSEISRVRKIINSKALKAAISKSNSLLARARKIQSDLEKLEAGTLYDWQQLDKGPKQSYASFKGGDRSASFIFALKGNSDWNVPK